MARSAAGSGPEGLAPAAERVLQTLFGRLAPLVGAAGFDALLGRALHLAKGSYPVLEGMTVASSAEGRLEGLRQAATGRPADELAPGLTALLADFLGLVGYFIGDDLVLREIDRAWPNLPAPRAGADHRSVRDA